jgi:hypothetical protein
VPAIALGAGKRGAFGGQGPAQFPFNLKPKENQNMSHNPKALQIRPPADLSIESANSSNDATVINESLKAAAETMHLVGPAPSAPRIAEDCEVMFSRVLVNADPKVGEVYPISGSSKFGLGKTPLEKIAMAAGISWDPELSRRDDDGSNPYYCEYTAVGEVFDFDGRRVTLIGTKSVDLRDGAALWQDAHERARDKAIALAEEANEDRPLNEEQQRIAISNGFRAAEKELRHARIHIVALAQSKARLRAIRSIGLKPSYTKEELAKPFVMAKLIWTGRTNDPVKAEIYAHARAEHFLGSSRRAYGGNALPANLAPRQLAAPPPVSNFRETDDDADRSFSAAAPFIDGAEVTNGNGGEHSEAETAAPAATEAKTDTPTPATAAPAAQAPAAQPTATPGDTTEAENFIVRFGRDKGKRLIEVKSLNWLVDALTASIEDESKAQYMAKNKADRAIILREQERRRKAGTGAVPAQSSAPAAAQSPAKPTLFD